MPLTVNWTRILRAILRNAIRTEVGCRYGDHSGRFLAWQIGRTGWAPGCSLFEVTVEKTKDGSARIRWQKVDAARNWATLSSGCCLLRSNVMDWTDEELWKSYIQLTEAEAAFRIHKGDLKSRPNWHQKEGRVSAHIFVCFLAYVLWKTLGQMCEQSGLGGEPRRILDELAELRMRDVILPTRSGVEIRRRCLSKPVDHQQILLDHHKLQLLKISQTEM